MKIEINREMAIQLSKSKFYETLSAKEIATFQLSQDLMCMPFNVFHKAVEEALNRPVWTHEFASPEILLDELSGNKPKPTIEEIINLIPENKRIILITKEGGK